jgi:hypothetical protein
VTRTIFLAFIALAVILIQLIPTQASTIKWATIALGIAYLGVRAVLTYPKIYRDRRRRIAQRAADERDFRQYEIELDAIHAKYDATDPADETESKAFRDELTALHEKYQEMLGRKFGGNPAGPVKSYTR